MKKYILVISVVAGTVALSSCVSKQKLVECETTNKTLTENLQAVLGRDVINPGIRVSSDDDEVITIQLEIIVYFGVNIPQLCYDIQTKVKRNIEAETGLEIKAINIRVVGIDERKE